MFDQLAIVAGFITAMRESNGRISSSGEVFEPARRVFWVDVTAGLSEIGRVQAWKANKYPDMRWGDVID